MSDSLVLVKMLHLAQSSEIGAPPLSNACGLFRLFWESSELMCMMAFKS